MAVTVKFNNKDIPNSGLICYMNNLSDAGCLLDILQETKIIDATGKIKVNDKEVENANLFLDTTTNEGVIDKDGESIYIKDLSRVHVEVNIYGDMDWE